MYFFCNRVLSYFAKPNFIVYAEWFDNDFQKTKLNVKNKKITNISNIHDFFMNNRIKKLVRLKINCKQILMKIGKNYLIIIILKTILQNMIHYQIKNFCSLKK